MRFWQAVVTAQMAAGSVYADRYSDAGYLVHLAYDTSNVVLSAVIWMICRKWFVRSDTTTMQTDGD